MGAAHRITGLLGLPIALAATLVQGLPGFRQPVTSMDEALLLQYPDLVGRGLTPNTDFYTVYGSLGFRFLDAWYDVFGYSVRSEHLAGLAYHLALVAGLWCLCLRFGAGVATISALVAVVFLPPDLLAYAWLGALSLAVWSMVMLGRDARWAWVPGGLLAGLSVGWRYEMAFVAVVAVAPLVLERRKVVYAALGFGVGVLPTLVHLAVAGPEVVDNVLVGRMGTNFQTDASLVQPEVYAALGLCGLCVAGLALRWWRTRDRLDLATLLLCLAVIPQALQRVDYYHAAFAAVAIVPLALAGLVSEPFEWLRRSRPVAAAVIMLASTVPALFAFNLLDNAIGVAPTSVVRVDERSITVPADQAPDLAATLDDLARLAPQGSAVFLGTQDMGRTSYNPFPLYFLLKDRYTFPAYYQELAVGVAERDGSGLSDDIRAADILLLSDFPERETKLLFPHAPGGFTEHNRTVRDGFREVARHGIWAILVRK